MPRKKKAIDYINDLCSSEIAEKRSLGNKLKAQYNKWTESLAVQDFLFFNEIIQENKAEIGATQFFGKFRAYAFEEYVYRLLQEKIRLLEPLQLFWGEKCLVWQRGEKGYAIEFDVSLGKKTNNFVEPLVVFEAKVELDSVRLKTALASFAILKQRNPKTRCVLVYVTKEIDSAFLELAGCWIDGIFQFGPENDESKGFLRQVSEFLS